MGSREAPLVCDKVTYESAGEAYWALREIQRKRKTSRRRGKRPIEKGHYRCPDCGKFHLTSQKQRRRR